MKKENVISTVLFCVAIALFVVSGITGLMPGFENSIDKISMLLGFVFMNLGFLTVFKRKEK